MEKGKKAGKSKRVVLLLIMLAAVIGIGVAIVSLSQNARAAQQNQQLQDAMREEAAAPSAMPEATAAPSAEIAVQTPAQPAWMADYAKTPDKTIGFGALYQTNPDIYAWITVPGTNIDHPVLFALKGDERYLTHDAQGNESKYGAIYTDGYNSADFSDPVTVVYGHNMKDGSMFAALHSFENGDFFDEHRTIRIYIGESMLEYEIFAAYKTDDTHLLYTYDFSDPDVFTKYMEGIYAIRDMSAKLRECGWDADSRIITLATCVKGEDTARYLVQGVLKEND